MYDSIIIGGGAAGLFCAANFPKNHKKLIIEKTESLGKKLLLSGGGRCNFSNTHIDPINDYFGQNKKTLPSLFHAFGANEMRQFLEENGIKTQEEDLGRLILKSGKAQELYNFLIKTAQDNETEIKTNETIFTITKQKEIFNITTNLGTYTSKNLIIATGGKSFPQIGATDFAQKIAKQFGLTTTENLPGLCGIETNEDTKNLTGNSIQTTVSLKYMGKTIYQQTGPLLFTHRGLSGPTIFNTTNALGEYKIHKKIGINNFDNFSITISMTPITTIKKISNHFNKQPETTFTIKSLRPREEAKVTVGGIHMKDINPNMESKKTAGLYFIGEALDITGKTGGYNLQRCRTSAFACSKNFKK